MKPKDAATTTADFTKAIALCPTIEEVVHVWMLAYRNEPARIKAFTDDVIKATLKHPLPGMTTGVKPSRRAAFRRGRGPLPGLSEGTARASSGRAQPTEDAQRRVKDIAAFFEGVEALRRKLVNSKGRPPKDELDLLFVIAADHATGSFLSMEPAYIPDKLRTQINKDRAALDPPADPSGPWTADMDVVAFLYRITKAMKWLRQHHAEFAAREEQKGPIVGNLRAGATEAERKAFWAAVNPPPDLSRDWTPEQTRKTWQRLAAHAAKLGHRHLVFTAFLANMFRDS